MYALYTVFVVVVWQADKCQLNDLISLCMTLTPYNIIGDIDSADESSLNVPSGRPLASP